MRKELVKRAKTQDEQDAPVEIAEKKYPTKTVQLYSHGSLVKAYFRCTDVDDSGLSGFRGIYGAPIPFNTNHQSIGFKDEHGRWVESNLDYIIVEEASAQNTDDIRA